MKNERQKTNDKILNEFRKRIYKVYKQLETDINGTIANAIIKYGIDVVFDFNKLNKYKRLDSINKEQKQVIKKAYSTIRKELKLTLIEAYNYNYLFTGFEAETQAQAKLGFRTPDKNKVFENKVNIFVGGKKLVDRIDEKELNLYIKVKKDFIQSIINKEKIQGVKGTIKKSIIKDLKNTIMISDTEYNRLKSLAEIDGIKQAEKGDIEVIKTWKYTNRSKHKRDWHQQLDGTSVKGSEALFYLSKTGTKTTAPRLSGVAEEDINCRCEITKEFSYKGTSKVKYDTFTEWFQKRLK